MEADVINPENGDEAEEGESELQEDRGEHEADDFAEDLARETGKSAGQADAEDKDGYADDGNDAGEDHPGAFAHRGSLAEKSGYAMGGLLQSTGLVMLRG